jgi:hypothetical protein
MDTLALGLGNLAGPDLLIILLIVFVLFGAKKLPDWCVILRDRQHPGRSGVPSELAFSEETGSRNEKPSTCDTTTNPH